MRKNKLSNKFLYDFVTLLYVYNEFINADVVKEKRFKQIQVFIDGRAIKNKEYFDKNEVDKLNFNIKQVSRRIIEVNKDLDYI